MVSNKKLKITTLLLSVLLLVSMVFYVTKATTPSTGPYYLSVPTSTWSYMISQFSNGTYYAVNGSNWHIDFQSTDASQIINWALGNLTNGGVIYIKPPFYAENEITISTNDTSIISDWKPFGTSSQTYGVNFKAITIASPSGGLRKVKLQGLFMYQLKLDNVADGRALADITLEDCAIAATSTTGKQGIIINEVGSFINKVWFVRCYFAQTGIGTNYGFITVTSGGGGQYYFENCFYGCYVDNARFIHIRQNCSLGDTVFTALSVYSENNNLTLVYSAGEAINYAGIIGLRFICPYLELHGNSTLVNIASGTNDMWCNILFDEAYYDPTSGQTITLANIVNTNFYQYWTQKQSIKFTGKQIFSGSITNGVWTESAYFTVIIDIQGRTAIHTQRQIWVLYNDQIAINLTQADINKHTFDLAGNLTETRPIIAVLLWSDRVTGTGALNFYPNEGTYFVRSGSTSSIPLVVLATGTNRLQYALSVANDVYNLYCFGYVVEG